MVRDHLGGTTGVAALSPTSGTLDLLVPDEEPETRRAALPVPAPAPATGYRRLFHEHVLGADRGCDFDFCVPPAGD